MRLHRFIGNYNLKQHTLHITDGEFYNQIKNVLRLVPGDCVILADGNGHEAEAKINSITPGVVDCVVVRQKAITIQSKRNVTLYCAMLKGDHFELVAQKATEVGISAIVPIITKRTVKLNCKHDRIEKIIKEAAEQCGRADMPILHEIVPFGTVVEQAKQHATNLFFDMSGEPIMPQQITHDNIGIFIGPEGGWDLSEIVAVQEYQFTLSSLGVLTLRAETAAIVASYLAMNI